MRNFQDTYQTGKRSFTSAFSICMTVPLIVREMIYYFSHKLFEKNDVLDQ